MRRKFAVLATVVCSAAVTLPTALAAQGPTRFEGGMSMVLSPASSSRIPEVMAGPMVSVRLADALGGIVGAEGAVRFRADGQQTIICPQPPGVVCDARNVRSMTTAALTFRRGFGAEPLARGALMRLGVGGAFTTLKGSATLFPNSDGSLPGLDPIETNAAMLDAGLGWIQRVGRVPVRLEGRVAGFAPKLANTSYVYGIQVGLGY